MKTWQMHVEKLFAYKEVEWLELNFNEKGTRPLSNKSTAIQNLKVSQFPKKRSNN